MLDRPVALFAVAAGAGILAALLVGLGVGAFVMAASGSECSPSDGWCELGAALLGLLAGLTTGAIAYLVAGVAAITHWRPAGRRSNHVVAHLALPVALALTLVALGSIV